MKKKELPVTKPGSKNIKDKPKKERRPGRGGSRPGSGQKGHAYQFKKKNIAVPLVMLEGMQHKNIDNVTQYVVRLIASDLAHAELPAELKAKIIAFL